MSSLEEIKNQLEHLNQTMCIQIQFRDILIDRLVKHTRNEDDDYVMSEREEENRDFDRFNGYPLIDEKEELLTQISDITSWIRIQKVLIAQDEIRIEMLEESDEKV
jgi:hypothetical protein